MSRQTHLSAPVPLADYQTLQSIALHLLSTLVYRQVHTLHNHYIEALL